MVLNGRVGQVVGPFDSKELLGEDGRIAQFTPETTKPILSKLGVQAPKDTIVRVNGVDIKIGRTCIYELDETVNVNDRVTIIKDINLYTFPMERMKLLL